MVRKEDAATSFIFELFQASGVPPEWADTSCGERMSAMLSKDDLSNGVRFILRLDDANGAAAQWVATLQGDIAAYWYAVYRNSDWAALRAGGARVFVDRVTDVQADHFRKLGRCVVIHTSAVKAEEITSPVPRATPRQPEWENDGGSLASTVSLSGNALGADATTTKTQGA